MEMIIKIKPKEIFIGLILSGTDLSKLTKLLLNQKKRPIGDAFQF